ncbi:MAG: membrane protein of unknown function [Promethearchaeota archaeon]|nr:MAG: membrane protein of unknown function [Candidatus Lokiarchaeota archaeon]
MKYYSFKLSETNSVNINIIRIIAIQIIAITHGLENIGAIHYANSIGVFCLNFLMLISGVLVSHSVFKSMNDKTYNFKKFFIKRFSRIYPVVLTVYSLIALVDWINGYNLFDHMIEFLVNLFLLNDSALPYKFYGYNRHLWIFPLFWWQYLLLGWLLLGFRTVKKKYVYFLALGFFAFMIGLMLLGMYFKRKANYLIIWFVGVIFTYLLNKFNQFIRNKTVKEEDLNRKKSSKKIISYKIRIISVILAIFCFFLAILRSELNENHTPYELVYNLFLAGSILFLFIFVQYGNFKYPQKFIKIVNFLSSYSLTMFLFHMCLYNLVLDYRDHINLFIYMHIIANLLSFSIASFTERKTPEIYSFFLKEFDLEQNSKKIKKPYRVIS